MNWFLSAEAVRSKLRRNDPSTPSPSVQQIPPQRLRNRLAARPATATNSTTTSGTTTAPSRGSTPINVPPNLPPPVARPRWRRRGATGTSVLPLPAHQSQGGNAGAPPSGWTRTPFWVEQSAPAYTPRVNNTAATPPAPAPAAPQSQNAVSRAQQRPPTTTTAPAINLHDLIKMKSKNDTTTIQYQQYNWLTKKGQRMEICLMHNTAAHSTPSSCKTSDCIWAFQRKVGGQSLQPHWDTRRRHEFGHWKQANMLELAVGLQTKEGFQMGAWVEAQNVSVPR